MNDCNCEAYKARIAQLEQSSGELLLAGMRLGALVARNVFGVPGQYAERIAMAIENQANTAKIPVENNGTDGSAGVPNQT